MPDVEVTCGACKGARFNAETLEVTVRGKTIADVLNMSVEEGVGFFADEPPSARKIEVLNDLGLGYLTLGQSATTLSGGEAQRIKIAAELSQAAARQAHALHSRRAHHRPAPRRYRAAARMPEPAGRCRPHRGRHRASPGCHQDRRSRHRSRPRRRPRRRRSHRRSEPPRISPAALTPTPAAF